MRTKQKPPAAKSGAPEKVPISLHRLHWETLLGCVTEHLGRRNNKMSPLYPELRKFWDADSVKLLEAVYREVKQRLKDSPETVQYVVVTGGSAPWKRLIEFLAGNQKHGAAHALTVAVSDNEFRKPASNPKSDAAVKAEVERLRREGELL